MDPFRDAFIPEPEAIDPTPIELRGIPDYEGPSSLLDALLCHGLQGCTLASIRRIAQTSTTWRRVMEDEEVWRLSCAALATEDGLYAPSDCANWKGLFHETLWPSRKKWQADESAESIGFRIRLAVRVRPRKHDGSLNGLVLPLHQRLRLLKQGEKIGSLEEERSGSSREQLAAALKEQGELPPELLAALLEAQQLGAVNRQAQAQAKGGPRGASEGIDVEEGSMAAQVAAAAAAAETEATPLTAADHKALSEAEAAAAGGGGAAARKEKAAAAAEAEDKENASRDQSKGAGSKLLLVQPSRVVMFVPGVGVRPFLFSTVCNESASQKDVYQRVAQDAVCSALNGMNACVLAYGQTGSGKTHTVFGPSGAIEAAAEAASRQAWRERRAPAAKGLAAPTELPASAGIVLRACDELLACASAPASACASLSLSAQYVQIYDECLTDLLSGGAVLLRESAADGAPEGGKTHAILQGAAHVKLTGLADALALLRAGELHKRVAATAMNDTSSRAHTVFLISLTQRGVARPAAAGGAEAAAADDEAVITSQLALVDLAGCEQVKQSKVVGQRLREAVGINSSLLVLGKCITALSEGRRHVPYQEAKLTKLLRGAFGGSSRTTCVIAASPDDAHGENTVQALRFGERCATITNSASIGAISAAQALASIDEALAACEHSMASLEARNRTALPAYGSLKARHQSLSVRRAQLSA